MNHRSSKSHLVQSLRKAYVTMRKDSRTDPRDFIIVVILPDNAGVIRNTVKYLGDVKIGVPAVYIITFHHLLADCQ
jgi:hypothetical protein